MNTNSSFDKLGGRPPVLIGVAALATALLLYFWFRPPRADALATAYHEVKRGDFIVSVVEPGNLAAVSEVSIRNEVEGVARIITIVPEGAYVRKGDLLVELDSAQAQDQVSQQQIGYEKAVFAVEQARAQLEIQRSATNSDFLAAELKVMFAEIDRDKYDQGQRLVDLVEASNKLVSAEAQLLVNQATLTNSVRLAEKGYETKQKVDGDRLAVLNNLNSVIVASNAIRMLSEFDIPKQTNKYHSDLFQAKQERDRVVNQNLRRMAQYEADLSAQSNTLLLSEQKLARDRRNLTNTIIRAPQDGLVVYAVSDSHFSSESLIEGGATVRNRQELIKLPDLSRMKVTVKVHESHINLIRRGLPAVVKLQSVAEQRFRGVVERVAPLPDTQARWGNPNLKVYNTDVHITDPLPNIKPGVSAEVEIIVTNIADSLSVPIQAVTTYKGKQVAYLMSGGKTEPRPVELGMYNTKFIQITKGLKEGDRVMLTPPFDTQGKAAEAAGLAAEQKARPTGTNAPPGAEAPAVLSPAGQPAGGAPPDLLPANPDARVGGARGADPGRGPRSGEGREGRGRGGGVSREEMLKRFDKNGDGELDNAEREAMRGARTNRGERLQDAGGARVPADDRPARGNGAGGEEGRRRQP